MPAAVPANIPVLFIVHKTPPVSTRMALFAPLMTPELLNEDMEPPTSMPIPPELLVSVPLLLRLPNIDPVLIDTNGLDPIVPVPVKVKFPAGLLPSTTQP